MYHIIILKRDLKMVHSYWVHIIILIDLNFGCIYLIQLYPFTVLFQENEIEIKENEIRNNRIYLFILINPNLANLILYIRNN